MSRLPDLEASLRAAAERLEGSRGGAVAPPRPDGHARRWRRRAGTPLLAAAAGLLVAGGAVAGVSGLLDDGEPVPAAPPADIELIRPVDTGFSLAAIRVPEPDGGPPWGVGRYAVEGGSRCIVVGRVQAGRLGVVGRDGVFGDDGRFHALAPGAQSSFTCGGAVAGGTFILFGYGPPIPASGYTGAPGTRIGGCRERVDLDGPTVSPQTRRRLAGVPQCSRDSLRQVVAGFAGAQARTATLRVGKGQRTVALRKSDDGAFLFVVRSSDRSRPRLTVTQRDGSVCEPFTAAGTPGTPASLKRAAACFGPPPTP